MCYYHDLINSQYGIAKCLQCRMSAVAFDQMHASSMENTVLDGTASSACKFNLLMIIFDLILIFNFHFSERKERKPALGTQGMLLLSADIFPGIISTYQII